MCEIIKFFLYYQSPAADRDVVAADDGRVDALPKAIFVRDPRRNYRSTELYSLRESSSQ